MKQSEKDQLISQLNAKITDWQTQWNLGKIQGIKEAIEMVEAMPVDPEEITDDEVRERIQLIIWEKFELSGVQINEVEHRLFCDLKNKYRK